MPGQKKLTRQYLSTAVINNPNLLKPVGAANVVPLDLTEAALDLTGAALEWTGAAMDLTGAARGWG